MSFECYWRASLSRRISLEFFRAVSFFQLILRYSRDGAPSLTYLGAIGPLVSVVICALNERHVDGSRHYFLGSSNVTPTGTRVMPVVDMHASLLGNVRSGDWIHRTSVTTECGLQSAVILGISDRVNE